MLIVSSLVTLAKQKNIMTNETALNLNHIAVNWAGKIIVFHLMWHEVVAAVQASSLILL